MVVEMIYHLEILEDIVRLAEEIACCARLMLKNICVFDTIFEVKYWTVKVFIPMPIPFNQGINQGNVPAITNKYFILLRQIMLLKIIEPHFIVNWLVHLLFCLRKL